MKIKLIHIPRLYQKERLGYQEEHGFLPPLGIATLKTLIQERGYTVDQDDLDIKVVSYNKNCKDESKKINIELFDKREIINEYVKNGYPQLDHEAEKILSMTNIQGYDVIGLSLIEESNFSVIGMTIVLSKLIKEKTGAIILIGGLTYPRPLVELNEFLNKEYIDFVIIRGGESPIINLLDAIENNELGKVKIDNVLTNNKKYKPKKNAKGQKIFFHLRDFILPDFDGLPLDLYRYYHNEQTKKKDSVLMLPYIFTGGCINKCIFCPMSVCNEFAAKKPEIVATEIKELSKKYQTKYFFFINTNINPSFIYTRDLCKEFEKKDLDILWTDCANFKFLDVPLLERLRRIGATRIVFGIESPNNRMLRYIHKCISVKKAETILKKSHELGIWNEIELIAGLPYETENDVKRTVQFVCRNGGYVNFFHLNRFILKDSLLYKYPEKYGLTNVKPLMNTIYEMRHFTRRFDEVNGLKWDDKVKQINNSFNAIDSAINEEQRKNGYNYKAHIHMPLLFYLYSKFENKKEIENYLREKIPT